MDITRKKSLIAPLTYLKATIDLGSYTKAAEYLGTTESRLSKEIKAFEKTMKTKLLSRCSRGMTPTHEGMEIYKQAERLDTLFYELENYSLAEHSISGHLKISMTDGIGIYIMPHLVEFHELYPKVCVDVISNHNEVNLKARKADIAIVYQYPQKDNSLVVKDRLTIIISGNSGCLLPFPISKSTGCRRILTICWLIMTCATDVNIMKIGRNGGK